MDPKKILFSAYVKARSMHAKMILVDAIVHLISIEIR